MELFGEGLGPVPPIEGHEGKQGALRRDLELLRLHLGGKPLVEGLLPHGIHRVVEVGVGVGTKEDLTGILQLAGLTLNSRPYFAKDDLLAIDPDFFFINQSKYLGEVAFWIDRFTREQMSVETLAELIRRGEQKPFDLVFSKGAVSIGGAVYNLPNEVVDVDKAREFALGIIPAMRDCLSLNPQALLMICTKYGDTFLPFDRTDLLNLGLKPVKFKTAEGSSVDTYKLSLRSRGLDPGSFDFYNIVICQREN